MLTTRWVCIRLSSSVSAQKCTWSRGLKGWVNINIGHAVFEFNIIISAGSWCIECHGQWHNLPDPAAAQCPQKVYSRMWDRDRENTTNARTPLNKFLQASSDIRYVLCKCKFNFGGLVVSNVYSGGWLVGCSGVVGGLLVHISYLSEGLSLSIYVLIFYSNSSKHYKWQIKKKDYPV